jgi:SAM-dependent methyltransferase
MHDAALAFYTRQLADLDPLDVVEFGSCNMNGSARDAYPQAKSWLGIDIQPGPGVDIVADAATWDTDQRFDVCICAEAFEHTPAWRDIIATAHRVLRDGGLFLASCATNRRPPHSAVDGGALRAGEYYANVSWLDLSFAMRGWSDGEVVEADGYFGQDDLYVWAIR